jgi:phosphonate transport system permease protein
MSEANYSMPKAPPLMRKSTALVLAILAALTVASFASLALDWRSLFDADAPAKIWEFLLGFVPPDTSPAILKKTTIATLETLAMSALGTGIAAAFGLLLALPASGRFGTPLMLLVRLGLNVARAIPELVWASIMLIAAGLGPFAGTIALAAHTTGVLGRLFAEALENASPLPESTLRTNGASATAAFLYATLPQRLPQMISYTLYRWENNIRAAAILGVVGAGGLGQMLKFHLSLFHMQSAATVIIVMLVLVALVDGISFAVRRWLVG